MKRFLTFVIIFSSLIFLILISSMLYRVYFHKPAVTRTGGTKADSTGKNVQISIMNGTSVSGLASKAGSFFRNKDFDVVEVGNYDEHVTHSFIVDRVNDRKTATHLAELAGVNPSVIVTEIDSTMYLKCTLVIGDDYKKLKPFKNE